MNQLTFVVIIMLLFLICELALGIGRPPNTARTQRRKPSLRRVKAALVCSAVLLVTAAVLIFVLPPEFMWVVVTLVLLSGFIRCWLVRG